MTKTKRSKRNEPNDQNETTKKVYKKKPSLKIKWIPSGVRCQSLYSSCLDYGLLLIYFAGKFSYLLIAIGLALGGEGTLIKEKNSQ